MSELVASQSWLEKCFANTHPFPEKKWLRQFREQQLNEFIQRGFPTRKEEAFKYTSVAALVGAAFTPGVYKKNAQVAHTVSDQSALFVFVNGVYAPELSHTVGLSKDIIACPLSEALELHEDLIKATVTREFDKKQFPFAILNSALMTDGLFLKIPKKQTIALPIHLLFINTEQDAYINSPRNIILAEENSQVTLIEEHRGESATHYFTNVVTDLMLANNARIDYYKMQDDDYSATHISNVMIDQQQDSVVNTYFLSRGAKLARENLTLSQRAKGTESQLYGLYVLDQDQQHIDHHVHVDHFAEHGRSTMLYKGILDKNSHAVFNGKVFVHQNAQHINAHQANHNLLLSNDAEIDTKPELEIYADDVKCTHGATVGQLDEESLFYLRTRGIERADAFKILTAAFEDEIFAKIENANIRQYIQKRMSSHDEL